MCKQPQRDLDAITDADDQVEENEKRERKWRT